MNSSTPVTNNLIMTVTSKGDPSLVISIMKYRMNLYGNYFSENFSGGKGSALYVRQVTDIRIDKCTFSGNGPVYAINEYLYSPYTKYYSSRSMTYYEEECPDEISYLESCNNNALKSVYAGIQWPIVRGALFVDFCTECDS